MGGLERYKPKNHEEAVHDITGNLFMVASLKDLLRSRVVLARNLQDTIARVRLLQAQAQIALWQRMYDITPAAFIYVPNVRHNVRDNRNEFGQEILIRDDTVKLPVQVPPEKFDLSVLRGSWRGKDVVLFNTIGESPSSDTYHLSIWFNGRVIDPRRVLGSRILSGSRAD